MGKTLSRIVKAGIGLVGAATLAFNVASCGFPGNNNPDPNKNYAPKASLYVNPQSVQVNSPVHLDLTGTDVNGPSDIAEYKIGEDKNNDNELEDNELLTIPSSSPIHLDNVTFSTSGNKKIIGQVTDFHGVSDKNIKNVVVSYPTQLGDVNISGYLQDNETDANQPGEVRLYIGNTLSQTDSDGQDFSFSVPSGSNVKLEGMIKDASGTQKSYVRTQSLGVVNSNQTGILVRAVPYEAGWIQTDVDNFIEHMRRVNFWNENGLEKWNQGELPDDSKTTYSHPLFKGIEISNGFNFTQQTSIINAIKNSKHPKASTLNIVIGDDHYISGAPEMGWGFVRLSKAGEVVGTRVFDNYGSDGYIERFETNLDPTQTTDSGLVNHEVVGHGLGFVGHADDASNQALFDSIMKYTETDKRDNPAARSTIFTLIDIKGNKLIDDLTFQGMEPEVNILSKVFSN